MKKLLLYLLIPCLTFLQTSSVFSQGVWEQLDIPYSGNVKSLTASSDGFTYAVTQTNLFRSDDAGENWVPLVLPGGNFEVATNQNGDLFVTNYDEILRSIDNGDTWEVIYSDSPPGFTTITVSPDDVIAAGNIDWEQGAFVCLSFDNGDTWVVKYIGNYTEQMNLAFNSQGQLFMGNENYLFRSDDLGTTWSDITPPVITGPADFLSIAFDTNDEIYLGLDWENGVYHSTNNGDTWERVFNTGARALAVNSNDEVFAGNYDLFMSSDHGDTWSLFPQLLNSTVTSVYIDVEDNIFAATSNGIFRSFDNGQSWDLSFRGLFEPFVTDVESYNQDVYMVKNGDLFHSPDLGISWEKILLPLRQYYLSSIEIKPDGELYVFGTYTIFDTYGIIMKSADNGQTWTEVVTRVTSDIAFGTGNKIFILSDSLIHRSTDNGMNWQILNQELPCINPTEIAITNTGVIFVNSSLCEDEVYVSTDDGNSWTEAGYGGENAVVNLEVNSQGDVYVLTDSSEIFASTDNGASWVQLSTDPDETIHALEIDYQDNLLIATTNGVLTSFDNGASWIQNSEGIEDTDITTLHVGIMGYAFIGTANGKLFRQDYNVETTDHLKQNLTIYPNPAREKFNLIYPWFQTGTVDQVNIFNVYGKLVKTVPFDNVNMEIDISGLQAGVYLVSINEGLSKKLIIQ